MTNIIQAVHGIYISICFICKIYHKFTITTMERVAVIGHSYVSRLEQEIENGKLGINRNLNLPPNYHVRFFGLRGATTSSLLNSSKLQDCRDYKPTKIFLQIGGNDINQHDRSVDVIQGIRNVIVSLQAFGNVRQIIVGSLFQRRKARGMSADHYNLQVDIINSSLKKLYDSSRKVHFWTICGLVKPAWDIWTADGVHLNEVATKQYSRQIRMAVKCDNFR